MPTVNLAYDPVGRLWEVSGATTTRFLYDGADLIAEYDASGNILRRYIHGPGVDEPLVWFEGSATNGIMTLHADERGSVTTVATGSSAALNINTYDAYGERTSTAPMYASRYGFTGQAWFSELGLYYYKARMYSPALGRFLQTDPIGYGDGMNMYAYVRNDPVNRRDPTGTRQECHWEEVRTVADAVVDENGYFLYRASYEDVPVCEDIPDDPLPEPGGGSWQIGGGLSGYLVPVANRSEGPLQPQNCPVTTRSLNDFASGRASSATINIGSALAPAQVKFGRSANGRVSVSISYPMNSFSGTARMSTVNGRVVFDQMQLNSAAKARSVPSRLEFLRATDGTLAFKTDRPLLAKSGLGLPAGVWGVSCQK